MIENMLHKHRYFGHSGAIHKCRPWSVTTIAPMKRGLKVGQTKLLILDKRLVTTIAPMKRGLKAAEFMSIFIALISYNHCPDEKGTERQQYPPRPTRLR